MFLTARPIPTCKHPDPSDPQALNLLHKLVSLPDNSELVRETKRLVKLVPRPDLSALLVEKAGFRGLHRYPAYKFRTAEKNGPQKADLQR